ncbi:MAG: IS3 family transposase [Nannocystaceae bacterium]|nr:IS3 family transposase [Nannocystaceae bacterium]
MRAEFARSKGRYGSPRIQHVLRVKHPNPERRRTAKFVRKEGLVARSRSDRATSRQERTARTAGQAGSPCAEYSYGEKRRNVSGFPATALIQGSARLTQARRASL